MHNVLLEEIKFELDCLHSVFTCLLRTKIYNKSNKFIHVWMPGNFCDYMAPTPNIFLKLSYNGREIKKNGPNLSQQAKEAL